LRFKIPAGAGMSAPAEGVSADAAAAASGGSALDALLERLKVAGMECHATEDDVMRVFVPGEGGARDIFTIASAEHVQVRHLRPSVPTLEDVFAKAVGEE